MKTLLFHLPSVVLLLVQASAVYGQSASEGYNKDLGSSKGTGDQDAKRKPPRIIAPDSSVPKECAVFSGVWRGEWRVGNVGASTLRVVSIDSGCIATYRINGLDGQTRIENGKMEYSPCNASTSGACRFDYSAQDDTLNAYYRNPAGGTNSAIFARIR